MRALISYTSVAQLLAHFSFSDGTTLHCQWLTSSIQSILPAAGVPCCYTGHNFRIGAVKIAASRGLPDHLIKILDRSYQIYICNPVSTIVGVAALTGICCISFPLPSCFCRVPQDFGSSGPGLHPALSPSSETDLGEGLRGLQPPFG